MALRTNSLTPGYRFNDATGRYVDATGRFVKDQAVLDNLDGYLTRKKEVASSLFEEVRAGRMDLAGLQMAAEKEIGKTNLAAAALAGGGWANMSQADYGRVGGLTKPQVAAWRDYMRDVAEGNRPLDGTVRNAIRGALQRARQTFHHIDGVEAEKRGWDEERNVLNDGLRHCAPHNGRPGCAAETAKGWQKRGVLSLPGERGCYGACACRMQRRSSLTSRTRDMADNDMAGDGMADNGVPRFKPRTWTPYEAAEAQRLAGEAVSQGLAADVDYSGFDPMVAEAMNAVIARHYEEFPALKGRMAFLGREARAEQIWKDHNFAVLKSGAQKEGRSVTDNQIRQFLDEHWSGRRSAFASYFPEEGSRFIYIREDFASDYVTTASTMAAYKAGGSQAFDTAEGLIHHELFHDLDDALGLSQSQSGKVYESFTEFKNKTSQEQVAMLSTHAGDNFEEYMADGWAEFQSSETPRQAAADIGQWVQERYNEKYGGHR